MQHPRRKPWSGLLACVLAGFLLFGVTGCGDGVDEAAEPQTDEGPDVESTETAEASPEEAEKKDEPKKEKPKKETTTSVDAAAVSRGALVIPINAEGTIRAINAAEIKFEIGGRIERIWIKEGQRVRKGQKLVTLDDREYRLALDEARARYFQGLGQLAVEEEGFDTKTVERSLEQQITELKQAELDGQVTREERLDRELELGMEAVRNGAYRRELLEVRSGLSMARADIARHELTLEKTIVLAPFAGVITGFDLAPKENVATGDLLARLVDDVNVEADVGVLESDLAGLEVGRPARVTIPALGETFELAVDVISPEINDESRTCSVLIRMKSDRGRVKPGMFVHAAIAGEIHQDKTLVPRQSILTRDGRPMLFRIEEDRAKWVYVQLGLRNDHVVEIARIDQGGPLDEGTLIVIDNHLTLTHDAKVKIRKTRPVEDPWLSAIEQE